MTDPVLAPSRIAVTGASGFLGRGLVARLRDAGHIVVTIGRGGRSDVRWDPPTGIIDREALEGVRGVVHLAAEPIAQRWTPRAKRAIRESRTQATRFLAETLARCVRRPEVLVCASGVGIYGSRGDEWLEESSATGDDFLAEVGRAWEDAAGPARAAGIRVVHLRTGVVLDPEGGALAKLLPLFRLGVGGPLGDGRQWMSWISREDFERMVLFVLATPGLAGPVNAVAPEPVTNATFAATLARVLRRPALIPAPAFAIGAVFGEMARGTILASQRARPAALESAGFRFAHPSLATALRAELGLAE
jgi:uncharacterized protein (TIGR01777 family)